MRPISEDLRNRVIKYLVKGNNYSSASRKFEISESAIRLWYLRYKETGSYAAKAYPGKKPRLSESEFTHYVDSHANSTLAQEEYLKDIESINKEDLVYIAESGIEPIDYKNRSWSKKGKTLCERSGDFFKSKN